MSEANVESVRRGFEALARGDIEEMLNVVHPEVELIPLSAKSVEGRVFRGHDGVREWDRDRRETWDLEMRPSDYVDLGDRVLVHGHARFRGRGSGVELDERVSWLFEFRDEKIVRLESFIDPDEARAAAGPPSG